MTSPTRTERATKLRHTPNYPGIIVEVVYFANGKQHPQRTLGDQVK